MSFNSRDIAIATLLAITIILIVVCRKWRLDAADVSGYWRTTLDGEHVGGEYNIVPVPEAGKRRIRIIGRSSPIAPLVTIEGDVRFLRRICVPSSSLRDGDGSTLVCGSVDLQGRHLDWGKGHRWVREGLFECPNCIA